MQITEQFDIVIIGAGASGLMAAYELSSTSQRILIVEARARIGGRIYTNTPASFSLPIERGAEFIHGEASLTFELLKRFDISFTEVEGRMYRVEKNEHSNRNFFNHEWETLLDELKKLKHDMTLEQFMKIRFPREKYEDFYDRIRGFVEGYNAANFNQVSAFALRDEWGEEEDPSQYRIDGGYGRLVEALSGEVRAHGVGIRAGERVTAVRWSSGNVIVETTRGAVAAKKCLITVPVTVLKSQNFTIDPDVDTHRQAAASIGFGPVTKIAMEFEGSIWETESRRTFKSAQFIFTDGDIPTWWTQLPDERPLLTGWIGGPSAAALRLPDQDIFELAIKTLSYAFDHPAYRIKESLRAWNIDQWLNDEFAQGAYSFMTSKSAEAIKTLMTPIASTLYFAGEAIYDGPHKSTVEAALVSGQVTAKKIISESH